MGVGAGLTLHLFSQWWLWISIVILLDHDRSDDRTRAAVLPPDHGRLRGRPSGVPRVSDEELEQLLRSARRTVITAIGVVGLLAILYLMLFKPF